MKKLVFGILIVCLYCFAYVYFAMYQDYTNRSLLGYLFMIIVTAILAFLGRFFSGYLPLLIGNIGSALVSYYFVSQMSGFEWWDGYFKPFTPYQITIINSILYLIPQIFAVILARKMINRVDKIKP